MKRTPVQIRVYNLAKMFNITLADTDRIIKGYSSYIKDAVSTGREVDVGGLAILYPLGVDIGERYTLAYDLKCLANELRLPCYTVTMVIQEYIKSLKEEILKGKSVEIRGIITILPLTDEGKITAIRTKASRSIKSYCEDYGYNARVKTHIALKRYVGREIEDDREDA